MVAVHYLNIKTMKSKKFHNLSDLLTFVNSNLNRDQFIQILPTSKFEGEGYNLIYWED